VQEEMKVNIVL